MVNQPNTTNGVGKVIEETKMLSVVSPTKIKETKVEKTMPLDDRLLRLDQLFEIRNKYDKLQQSKIKLKEFKVKKDTDNITLSLSDYNQRNIEFSTKNPDLIKAVIDCIEKTITLKINELEPKLVW